MSEQFGIDSGVRQGCVMSPSLFYVYMDAVMKEGKMGMGNREENGDYLAACMKASYDGSEMWRGWRVIGSPRESI